MSDDKSCGAVDRFLVEVEKDKGNRVGWVCPTCQASLNPDQKFCPKCSLKERVEDGGGPILLIEDDGG